MWIIILNANAMLYVCDVTWHDASDNKVVRSDDVASMMLFRVVSYQIFAKLFFFSLNEFCFPSSGFFPLISSSAERHEIRIFFLCSRNHSNIYVAAEDFSWCTCDEHHQSLNGNFPHPSGVRARKTTISIHTIDRLLRRVSPSLSFKKKIKFFRELRKMKIA